jgi:soluble lytic murein transglycosylase-like protein
VAARQQAMHDCWSGLVGQYAWPSTTKVWSVMWCESKGDPTAHNASGANGLMQEMNGPYDPAANIARAWSQSRHGTYWVPWSCS